MVCTLCENLKASSHHRLSLLALVELVFLTETRLSSRLSRASSPRSSSRYASSVASNVSNCSSRVSVTRLASRDVTRSSACWSRVMVDFSRESVRAMLFEMEVRLGSTGRECALPLSAFVSLERGGGTAPCDADVIIVSRLAEITPCLCNKYIKFSPIFSSSITDLVGPAGRP